MKVPKGLLKGITVFIIAGLVGWGIWVRIMPTLNIFKKEEQKMPVKQEKPAPGEVPVQAAKVVFGPLVMRISGNGTAEPFREIPVNARASGELISLMVKDGQMVNKGDLLFSVDSMEKYITYQEREVEWKKTSTRYVIEGGGISTVEARELTKTDNSKIETFIKQATEEWRKAEALLQAGTIDKNEYDLCYLNYRIAEVLSTDNSGVIRANMYGVFSSLNSLNRAKLDLENTRGIAPIIGVVGRLSIQQGQQISAGTKTLSVIDDTKIRVVIGVLSSEVPELVVGRKARVKFVELGDEEFNGFVETISPIIENKKCDVRILIENPNRRIKTGMFAMANIDAKVYENRLLVPKEAVVERDMKLAVFGVKEGKSNWIYVTTGLQNDEYIEIIESAQDQVKPGELVLISGNVNIGHDIPIKIINIIEK